MYVPLQYQTSKNSRIKLRSKLKLCVSVVGLCLCALINPQWDPKTEISLWKYMCLSLPFLLLKLVFRWCIVLLEEVLFHFDARYDRSWRKLVKYCFNKQHCMMGALTVVATIVTWCLVQPDKSFALLIVFAAVCLSFIDILAGWDNAVLNQVLMTTPSMAEIWANGAFTSYYTKVLENICERISLFEKKSSISISVRKFILHIPHDCDVRKTFDVHFDDIKYMDDLEHIPNDQGANMNRCYKNPVYEISAKNQKPFYVIMEQPSSLLTLFKLKNIIPQNIIEFQRNVFISTLRNLLKDEPCVILISDGKLPLGEFLYKEIRGLVEEQCNIYEIE